MNASIVALKPSQQVSVQVETDYITQKHDCTQTVETFDPADCFPCIGCDHAECRHDLDTGEFPGSPDGLTGADLKVWQFAQAQWVTAALKRSPCGVDGCACSRMRAGDECTDCAGEGFHEDERTGRTYTCTTCRGNQVIA